MEPIGGVEINAPVKESPKAIKQENGEILYEVIIDNGSKDGIKVEYKAQKGKTENGNFLPPVIFYDEKTKELSLRNLDRITVFGSEKDDNIKTTCTNSVFHFKQGGKDTITQKISGEIQHKNTLYIDEKDEFLVQKTCNSLDDLNDDDPVFEFPFKKTLYYQGTNDNKPTLNFKYDEIEEM